MAVQAPPADLIRLLNPQLRWFVARAGFILHLAPEVVPTSWWRSGSHNAQVGGHQRSQHLLGLAGDLVHPNRSEWDDLATLAKRLGLVAVVESSHVHVQAYPAGWIPESVYRAAGIA